MTPFIRQWGKGIPVIALHPLGLDSSGFAGVGRALARRGMRTIAVDLPGFGRTVAPEGPLGLDVLAKPVIEIARSLETPPIVLGISLGGRVAVEAALIAPEAFRAVVPIAPYLPWLRFRFLLKGATVISPELAAWLPLERIWPVLRYLADTLQRTPWLREDELAQAGVRFVYYLACPATRMSFLSVARELALDPAFGKTGFWTRLERLEIPTAFVWGEQDQLISMGFAHGVAQFCPQARQFLLPCAGHWMNGPHHRCVAEAIAGLAAEMDTFEAAGADGASGRNADARRVGAAWLATRPCRVTDGSRQPRQRSAAAKAHHG
jgi:pimeloyl-ACP methyl ester carboxylesterase